MPLYEYRCLECQHEFEALVPAVRADQAACPECGVEDVLRLLSMNPARRGTMPTTVPSTGTSPPGQPAAPVKGRQYRRASPH